MKHLFNPGKNPFMKLIYRVGRRGSYLIFLALLDILYGYSIIIQTGPLFTQVDLYLSDKMWGLIWIAAALIIFVNAFLRMDRVGYVVATVLKFVWGTLMAWAWAVQPNDPRGWAAAVIWFAFGILTAIVANWPEHRQIRLEDFNGDRN